MLVKSDTHSPKDALGSVLECLTPQKSEVRFTQPQAVFTGVRSAVSRAISGFRGPVVTGAISVRDVTGGWSAPVMPAAVQVSLPEQSGNFKYCELQYIGQLLDCYLLCEYQGRFVVIDMHAAHERINYNRLRKEYQSRSVRSQMVAGLSLPLSETALERAKECAPELELLGFVLEFGPAQIKLRAHPTMVNSEQALELLHDVATDESGLGSSSGFESRLDALCARTACHASVRAGKMLSAPEVRALFAQLEETEMSAACPHGRPAVVSFSRVDVERWFGRDR